MQGRTPLDLLSAQLAPAALPLLGSDSVPEALSWGHGANYQLGTGTLGAQTQPVRCCTASAIQLAGCRMRTKLPVGSSPQPQAQGSLPAEPAIARTSAAQ